MVMTCIGNFYFPILLNNDSEVTLRVIDVLLMCLHYADGL